MSGSVVPPTGSNPALGDGDSAPVPSGGLSSLGLPQLTGKLAIVDKVVGVLLALNVGAPIAFEAVRGIVSLFRGLTPDAELPTDADVIARLRERAMADKAGNEQWLRERGYLGEEDPNG